MKLGTLVPTGQGTMYLDAEGKLVSAEEVYEIVKKAVLLEEALEEMIDCRPFVCSALRKADDAAGRVTWADLLEKAESALEITRS